MGRNELYSSDATRKALTFHDLRATGITWCAIRGDDAIKLQRRAGHVRFTTTSRFIREAQNVREGFGSAFPPLPSCLGLADVLAGTEPLENDSAGKYPANSERPQREPNRPPVRRRC